MCSKVRVVTLLAALIILLCSTALPAPLFAAAAGSSCQPAAAPVASPAPAAEAQLDVTLSSDHVLVSWTLALPVDHKGFNLYRGTTMMAAGLPLTEMIQSPRPLAGGESVTCAWRDYDIDEGTTYFYWLEDVDSQDARTLHGPVAVLYQTEIPTAVTLREMAASSGSPTLWPLLAAAIFSLIGLAVLWLIKHPELKKSR
jgi:hypothetical protein